MSRSSYVERFEIDFVKADAPLRALLSNRATLVAVIVLGIIAVSVLIVPMLASYSSERVFWESMGSGPSLQPLHFFGIDLYGRDLLLRTLEGGRISLLVGVASATVSTLIGVPYGAVAGFIGGRTDQIMMRIVDVLYCLPFMFFAIVLTVLFGRNLFLIFVAIGAVGWLTMARVVRGQTLLLATERFIDAAIICGSSRTTIITRHIIPNLLGTVLAYAALSVPQMILVEGFLSFLGLGVQEPRTSWGALISEGAGVMETAPWVLIFPGALLTLTVLSLNVIADGMCEVLDVRR